ncbi:hypothetical protein BKA81DRAFT_42180 [Phyllosticta paracitricarpa]
MPQKLMTLFLNDFLFSFHLFCSNTSFLGISFYLNKPSFAHGKGANSSSRGLENGWTQKFIFLVMSPACVDVAVKAADAAGFGRDNVFLVEGKIDGFATLQELVEVGKNYGNDGQVEVFKIPPGKKNGDICGYLSFSSGTTGLQKAASRFELLGENPRRLSGTRTRLFADPTVHRS